MAKDAAKFKLTPAKTDRCESCPLFNGASVTKRCTTEYWSKRPDVLIIAEAPGETENRLGRPVIGKTGSILRRVVESLNDGKEANIAYANIVQCHPPDNRDPSNREIECCRENVRRDIARLKPKQIVICGRPALLGLALDPRNGFKPVAETKSEYSKGGRFSQIGMGEARGLDFVVEDSEGNRYPAISTWHFAFIARNSRQFSVFKADIARAFWRARNPEEAVQYTGRGKKVVLLNTVKKVKRYLKLLHDLGPDDIVAMDYETNSVARINPHILTIGFAHGPDRGYVIPWRHPESPWTGKEFKTLKKLLAKFFSDKTNGFGALVAHNLKFEAAVTREEFGTYMNAFPVEDTELLAYSLNENRGGKKKDSVGYGLKRLVEEWMAFYHYRDEDLAPVVKLVKTGNSDKVPLRDLAEYNGMDCYATYRLYRTCYQLAKQEKYSKKLRVLSRTLLGPEAVFVAQMERNGFRLNRERLRDLLKETSKLNKRIRLLDRKLRTHKAVKEANDRLRKADRKTGGMKALFNKERANWVFNLNKPEHRKVLFIDVLELEPVSFTKKTKTPSINTEFYEKYKDSNDVAAIVHEWTTLAKLKSTFIEGAFNLIQSHTDMRDGRVRSTYWIHGTDTGRLSSSDPNMQQIPSREKHEYTKEIKTMYYADDGNVIVCADYSQAEVRWLAVEADDSVLGSAFKAVKKIKQDYIDNPTDEALARMEVDGDFHKQTASKVFKKPPEKISKDERSKSKAVVFGIVYGQTKYGLARTIKATPEEAEKFQDKFLSQFPNVKAYLLRQERRGFRKGNVESSIGRRRRLSARFLFGDKYEDVSKIGDKDIQKYVQHEHNVSRNAPIQGIASDTNLMACITIQNYIEKHKKKWRLVNVVHDSIIAEVPFHEVEEYIKVAKRIMEDPDLFSGFGLHLEVPFEADFSVGINWGQQYDLQVFDTWKVVCDKCGKSRKEEGKKPTNKRCESCGSKKVQLVLTAGPVRKILRKIQREHKIARAA